MARNIYDNYSLTEEKIKEWVYRFNEEKGDRAMPCTAKGFALDAHERSPVMTGIRQKIVSDFEGDYVLVTEEPRCRHYNPEGMLSHPDGMGLCENYTYMRIKNGNPDYCKYSNLQVFKLKK